MCWTSKKRMDETSSSSLSYTIVLPDCCTVWTLRGSADLWSEDIEGLKRYGFSAKPLWRREPHDKKVSKVVNLPGVSYLRYASYEPPVDPRTVLGVKIKALS